MGQCARSRFDLDPPFDFFVTLFPTIHPNPNIFHFIVILPLIYLLRIHDSQINHVVFYAEMWVRTGHVPVAWWTSSHRIDSRKKDFSILWVRDTHDMSTFSHGKWIFFDLEAWRRQPRSRKEMIHDIPVTPCILPPQLQGISCETLPVTMSRSAIVCRCHGWQLPPPKAVLPSFEASLVAELVRRNLVNQLLSCAMHTWMHPVVHGCSCWRPQWKFHDPK